MKNTFLSLIIIFTAHIFVFCNNTYTSFNNNHTCSKDDLKIKTELENIFYCEKGKVELLIKLSLKNDCNQTILLFKDSFPIQDFVYDSKTIKENKTVIKTRIEAQLPIEFSGNLDSPDSKYFIRLKPNQTYEISRIAVREYRNTDDFKSGLKFGNYFLRLAISTFPFGSKYYDLMDKWEKYGYLWLDIMLTPALKFKIEESKQNSPQKCEEIQNGLKIETRIID
ncbi:MAG TPA: hypothetical protein PKY82_03435 [Pyrinomonadaceae bacterium]|nr:hypothetical protein [Pyrinomonadaceae bacterium]